MPNNKPSNKLPQPKPTAVNHARLAEKCKQSGVPHYTVDNPHPDFAAIRDEIGSGYVLFTPVTPSSKKPQDNAHKEEDGND